MSNAGRPCKYTEPMKTIAFRIPESLAIMAQGKAMAEGKTLSEVIREALERYTNTVGFDKEKYDREHGIME